MSNTDLIARLRVYSFADAVLAADALTAQAREIEALTIQRDLNVRQCDAYQSQFEALRADAERLAGLRDLCGYVEDGSSEVLRISQDDATKTWVVSIGKKSFYESSFRSTIDAAIDAGKAVTP